MSWWTWIKQALMAWGLIKVGEERQASADLQAAQTDTVKAFKERQHVEDVEGSKSDDAARATAMQWGRDSGSNSSPKQS